MTLPQGDDTPLGERGGQLRVASGSASRWRGRPAAPEVLVLDEPTSALDPETEAAIDAALSAAGDLTRSRSPTGSPPSSRRTRSS